MSIQEVTFTKDDQTKAPEEQKMIPLISYHIPTLNFTGKRQTEQKDRIVRSFCSVLV